MTTKVHRRNVPKAYRKNIKAGIIELVQCFAVTMAGVLIMTFTLMIG